MSDNTDVGDFHCKFELMHTDCTEPSTHRTNQGPGPREWDRDWLEFRIKFLKEELIEFIEAVDAGPDDEAPGDHAKMFDALLDLVYVAHGTAHGLGYPWEEGWDRVQHANMQKVRAAKDGSDSVRGSSFDVIKPPGWTPPNIEGLLKECGFDL